MAAVAKRLTHRIVAPTLEGSTPFGRPTIMQAHSQGVRQGTLTPSSLVQIQLGLPLYFNHLL